MCKQIVICFFLLAALPNFFLAGQANNNPLSIEIFSDRLFIPFPPDFKVDFGAELSKEKIRAFHQQISHSDYSDLVLRLIEYKDKNRLNDWFYYQLIRKTAQAIAPKEDNYYRYTLYKWFLMVKSGYDARLAIRNEQLLFYVHSNDEVFSIPIFEISNKQYVCLNIHDYIRTNAPFSAIIDLVDLPEPQAISPFSYAVSRLPEFDQAVYEDRQIFFTYGDRENHFQVKLNPLLQQIYANYPIVNYGAYFNIPVSKPTYQSLIPSLKTALKGQPVKNGVDYLMKFTRNSFLYEDDQRHFGKEKRMAPEETLLANASDCDDRAALFYFLVKEIYNLPMIVLLYPEHITVAVQLKKGYGKTITHKGKKYSICEPTPQGIDLSIGQISSKYKNMPFEVVYAYNPWE